MTNFDFDGIAPNHATVDNTEVNYMRCIYITGMGRSGTSMVARLISHAENVVVQHEGLGNREFWLLSWYLKGDDYAIPFLEKEKRAIWNRLGENSVFVDVNGYLQNSVNELRQVFDGASVYHLVRDGRDVVRSLFSRRSDERVHLIPKNKVDVERWFELDKFSQVCWNWNETTRTLLDAGLPLLKLENVVNDYAYFRENFLDCEGIEVPVEKWSQEVSLRHNRTRSALYRFLYAKWKGKSYISTQLPKYENWTSRQKASFDDICGETMRRLGYPLNEN